MAGKLKSRKRKGTRGDCTYCGKRHRKGKKNNSCRRGAVLKNVNRKPKMEAEEETEEVRAARGKPGGNHAHAVARRERAAIRRQERAKRSDEDQLAGLVAQGHGNCQEADRLRVKIVDDRAKAAEKLKKKMAEKKKKPQNQK